MATLKSKHKRFIVKRLAVYDRPKDIREKLRQRWGIDAAYNQLAHYNPTTKQGQELAEQWRQLFQDVRSRFLKQYSASAIQHKAVRLKRLERAANKFHEMGNYVAEMEALKQAAKEVGGKFTNRTELSGPGGGPIEVKDTKLSDAELARIAAEAETHTNGEVE